MSKDRQPRISDTSGTGIATTAAIGRGIKFFEKHCEQCGDWFSVPHGSFAKESRPLMSLGQEVPCLWYCATRQTRLNGAADYSTDGKLMTRVQAEFFFEDLLFGKSIRGRASAGNMAQIASIYRKVDLQDDMTVCRKCWRLNKRDKAAQHVNERIVIRSKTGERRELRPNAGKPLPEHLRGFGTVEKVTRKQVGKHKVEEVRYWYCSTPSTRHEISQTIKTDAPCTLSEAKEFFRFATGRATLAGCSITG